VLVQDTSCTLPSVKGNDLWETVNTLELKNGQGRNREKNKTCITESCNDYEAFQAWLKKYEHKSPLTQQLYKREIERLFIWAISERKKVISDFTVEDFQAYLRFLSNPAPAEKWIMKPSGKTSYGSEHWRPFTRPLSITSKAKSMTIIRTMLDFWIDIGYLSLNPLKALAGGFNNPDPTSQTLDTQARILEPEELAALLQTVLDLPEKTPHQTQEKMRLNLILKILFYLGLRINELVTHTWGAFQKVQGKWWFFVKGKGGKRGKIPIHHDLWDEIKAFRHYFEMPEEPIPLEENPIIPNWRHEGKALGARQINKLLKDLARRAGKLYFYDQPHVQNKLEKFSAHWGRHLSATWQGREGLTLAFIQANLRHSKEGTSRIYIHENDNQRHEAMQKLKLENIY